MNSLSRNALLWFGTLFVLGAIFLFGVYVGITGGPEIEKVKGIVNKETAVPTSADFDPFWKAWNILNEKYAGSEELPTDQDKVWGAIEGLVKSFNDPYSVFFPPEDAEIFEDDIRGEFGGVGMEIGVRDGFLTVVTPMKGTPAERAGIKTGDRIAKIDGEESLEMSVDKAVRLIRGEPGTEVKLTFFREGEENPIDISIVRAVISIPTLDTAYYTRDGEKTTKENTNKEVFVLSLYSFSATSGNLFRDALIEFRNSGLSKLVIDLRGNPGGYLDQAVHTASFFLESGKLIVSEDFKGKGEAQEYRSRGFDLIPKEIPVVILVNEGSASASEIFAGALKEHERATIVGQTTFGKGSVQELVEITEDTSLKVTVAEWLTPNGNSLSKQGVKPDIEISLDEEKYKNGVDTQLVKAIETVTSK